MSQSKSAIEELAQTSEALVMGEWFARPFEMGRIRESLDVDRGNDIDILNLLENQGFDAIKVAGGVWQLVETHTMFYIVVTFLHHL